MMHTKYEQVLFAGIKLYGPISQGNAVGLIRYIVGGRSKGIAELRWAATANVPGMLLRLDERGRVCCRESIDISDHNIVAPYIKFFEQWAAQEKAHVQSGV